MHDEDEGVAGDEFEMSEDADLEAGGAFEPDEEDSYDPDDRFH